MHLASEQDRLDHRMVRHEAAATTVFLHHTSLARELSMPSSSIVHLKV
jgi:hypothetical protein